MDDIPFNKFTPLQVSSLIDYIEELEAENKKLKEALERKEEQ
ncbi:MAG: hypothetical protein ACI4U9_03335 [Clostridia bacterium]